MFPPGRPPDRVLYFIIKIKEISGLKDVEMQSQYDDKTIMIRVVQHQHGGISLRLVWDPRITVFDKLTTDPRFVFLDHSLFCFSFYCN
jgi:hypothetical protein